MMRAIRFLLLGCALLWAQWLLAGHGIEHAFSDHDEACFECLVLPGFAAVPARPAQSLPPCPGQDDIPAAALPAPTFSFPALYRSRAPPFLQSA